MKWSTLLHVAGVPRLPGQQIAIRRELAVGGRIPDVVVVRFPSSPRPEFSALKFGSSHAFTVWQLKRSGESSVSEIAGRVYAAEGVIQAAMNDLIAAGIACAASSESYSLERGVAACMAEVVAVEVKLTRWKDAVEQAESYLSFADYGVVAMTEQSPSQAGKIMEAARVAGLGYLEVGANGARWLVEPVNNRSADGTEREWIIARASPLGGGGWRHQR